MKERTRSRKGLIILILILVLLLASLGGFLFYRSLDPHDNRIISGISIAGVDVGGMTKGEARKAIAAVEDSYTSSDMVITLPDKELRFSPADTGAKLDVKAAVKEAYLYGRKLEMPGDSLVLDLVGHLSLNTAYIQDALSQYAAGFDGVYTPTTYSLQGDMPELAVEQFDPNAATQTVEVKMGTPGLAINMDELYRQILDAYNSCEFSVTCGLDSATRTPEPLKAEALLAEFGVDPVNATLNTETYSAIPGAYGYGFDTAKIQTLLDAAAYGETLSFPMEYIEAEITEENVFFQDVLGYCETKHTEDENRNTNLRLVCEILSGMILQPGEEFSFNGAVGERTKERGFLPAPAYSGHSLVNQYGGGVCQTSSTLYNCALLADLEITNRVCHGYQVRYLPVGLDATVNYLTTDFRFVNSLNYPIMLGGEVSDGMVKMWILGVDDKDYYVKMESTSSSDDDWTYAVSYRCKYDKETDELISRELESRSTYKR